MLAQRNLQITSDSIMIKYEENSIPVLYYHGYVVWDKEFFNSAVEYQVRELKEIMRSNSKALHQIRMYHGLFEFGHWTTIVGIASIIGGIGGLTSGQSGQGVSEFEWGILGSGVVLSVVGSVFVSHSYKHIAKAVEIYNAGLANRP